MALPMGDAVRDVVERAAEVEPRRRLWTRREFERAAEVGPFGPEERLELVGGEVVRKVTPQHSPHAACIRRWIVNLCDRVLEVHRNPAPMAAQPFGHHYRSVTRAPDAARAALLAAPEAVVAVADLFPRPPAGRR